MKFAMSFFLPCAVILLVCAAMNAQQAVNSSATIVPRLVHFSGKAVDDRGKPIAGAVDITFAIYTDQSGGAPLWMETQNVTADAKGNYTVQLGAAQPEGLPLDLFTSGEARWLGVRTNGGEEQPRVLLLSVPYALKAADAQTLGGLPASAFMLAAPATATAAQSDTAAMVAASSTAPPSPSNVTTTGGTVNALPLFTTSTNIQSSILTQTGATAINVSGELNLPATGSATASKGFPSRPFDLVASSFNSATAAPVAETLQWQAEQANNNTANPSAVLSLLYGSGTTAPAETGLRIGPKGILGFAPGQTFSGTVTGVTAGADLTVGGTSSNPTLSLNTTATNTLYAQLAAANTFTANQSVTGNIYATGSMGIGTTNPVSLLTVSGLSNWGQSEIVGPASAEASMGFRPSNINRGGLGDWLIGTNTNASSAGGFVIENAIVPYLNITSGGNVGIGNRAPLATLDISGGAGIDTYIGNPGCGSPSGGIAFGASGFSSCMNYSMVGDSSNTFIAAPTGEILFRVNKNNTTAMTMEGGLVRANQLNVSAQTGAAAIEAIGWSSSSGSNGGTAVAAYGGNATNDEDTAYAGGTGLLAEGGKGGGAGVTAIAGAGGVGVYALGSDGGDEGGFGGNGVEAFGADGTSRAGIGGYFAGGDDSENGDGLYGAVAELGLAGNFFGNVKITGDLSADFINFEIDHPLDPANKYLVHASVESSEMMDIYTGNVTTDSQGEARVLLPDWFEVLNTDFRYHLTVIGQFAQATVASEIQNHQFQIKTNAPNVKVSWQVTGVRQDPYAKAHPLVVEQEKDARLKGFYIHPDLYGQPEEKQIEWARHPQMMKRIKQQREKQAQSKVAALAKP